mmetsp:Transcript_9196/g.37594  ORF Transcript_9196/g.37594 Transcript_9196/m.37594 type:complete len:235 (+) Transcript_9196:552-1256(+)
MLAPVRTAQKSRVVRDRMMNTMYGGRLNRQRVDSFVRSTTSSVKFVSFFELGSSPSMQSTNAFRNVASSLTAHWPPSPSSPLYAAGTPFASTHVWGVSGSISMIRRLSMRSIQSRLRMLRMHPAIASCCALFTLHTRPKSRSASLPVSVYSKLPSCGSAWTNPVRNSCALLHSTPICTIFSWSSSPRFFIGSPSIHSCVSTVRPVSDAWCLGTTTKSRNLSALRKASALSASRV